jgi:ABC-type Fe3+/spermidine/putrescine transport system ATPase subunit
MVFQDYALFLNLTVLDNIAFDLHGQPAGERLRTCNALLELVKREYNIAIRPS